MARIDIVRGPDISASFRNGERRQYLAGSLSRPQDLQHVPDAEVEVGIASYPEADADQPHFHLHTREYQYVVSGLVLLRDLSSGEVFELHPGDFYVVSPGVAHVQKCRAGTRIIFFKHPAGDDKTPVEVDTDTRAWLNDLPL